MAAMFQQEQIHMQAKYPYTENSKTKPREKNWEKTKNKTKQKNQTNPQQQTQMVLIFYRGKKDQAIISC